MKWVKRIAISLLVIVLLAAGTVYFVLTRYKSELKDLLVQKIRDQYHVDLKIASVDVSFFSSWPHASVLMRDVSVRPINRANDSTLFIQAKAVALSFNLEKLLRHEFVVKFVQVKDAEVLINKDTANVKPVSHPHTITTTPAVKDSSKPFTFDVRSIKLRNLHFRFQNKARGMDLDLNLVDNFISLVHPEEGFCAHITGKIYFTQMLFKRNKGAFLKHARALVDLHATWFSSDSTLMVRPPSFTVIDNQQYATTGLAQFNHKKTLALHFKGYNIEYEKAAALLPDRIRKKLNNFQVKKPFDADVQLVAGINKKQDPGIILHLSGEHSDLEIGSSKIPYSDVSFHGRLISIDSTKTRGDIDHAVLLFYPVRGRIYDQQFTAKVSVTNITNPYLRIHGKIDVITEKLSIQKNTSYALKGKAAAVVDYEGPTIYVNKREFLGSHMKLKVQLTLDHVLVSDKKRPYTYLLNGSGQLGNHDLKIDHASVETALANFTMNGKVTNFMEYALGQQKAFSATLNAHTKKLNLDPLIAKPSRSAGKPQTVEQEPVAVVVDTAAKSAQELLKQKADEGFRFTVKLSVDSLKARRVNASNAQADFIYFRDVLDVKRIRMDVCEGNFSGAMQIADFNKVSADVDLDNVDVKELFSQFENFGQSAITDDNLQGRISVNAKFNSYLNDNMGIIGETMSGDVSLRVKDGHIVNFEPIQNLSNFLFRNRDFNDVWFSEIVESFHFKGTSMRIRELELASSLLDLYVVDGVYDFRGISTLNLLLPWSNLKRRGKNYIPKSSGEVSSNTKGLKLCFQGPPGKIKISLGHKPVMEGRSSL